MKANTTGAVSRKVRLSVGVRAVNYIGVSKSVIRKFSDTVQVQPGGVM